MSYFTFKDKNSGEHELEGTWYDILAPCEKMIYIDIGYKLAMLEAYKLRNDTKDKEATLI